MATAGQLPPELKSFGFRNAAQLRPDPDFREDAVVDHRGLATTSRATRRTAAKSVLKPRTRSTHHGQRRGPRETDAPELRGTLSRTTLVTEHNRIVSLAFAPNGGTLISGSQSGMVTFWDTARNEAVKAIDTSSLFGQLHALARSPDGSLLAIGSEYSVNIWDLSSGGRDRTVSDESVARMSKRSVSFALSGDVLLATGTFGKVRAWNLITGDELHHSASAKDLIAVASDGTTIVSKSSQQQGVIVWTVEHGDMQFYPTKHDVVAIAIRADTDLVAVASVGSTIELWDVRDDKKHAELEGHSGVLSAVAFSPDGTVLASACRDKTIRLWSCRTGELIRTISDHTAGVLAVAFSDDGTVLASGGGGDVFKGDTAIRLWRLNGGGIFAVQ